MMPATCVPWPKSSTGWSGVQTPELGSRVKSLKCTTAGDGRPEASTSRSSFKAEMPESMMATPTPRPVTPKSVRDD